MSLKTIYDNRNKKTNPFSLIPIYNGQLKNVKFTDIFFSAYTS